MTGRMWRVLVSLGICGLVGYLTFVTMRDNLEFYYTVDEIQLGLTETPANPEDVVQMHGYVVPGSIHRRIETLEYWFILQNDPPRSTRASQTRMSVTYTGVVPDTFRSEAEVVVRGTVHPDTTGASVWTFEAEPNGITAKCPSKYEAARARYPLSIDDITLTSS